MSASAGWFLRRATVDDEDWLEDARAEFDAFLRTRLYVDADGDGETSPDSGADAHGS